MEYEDIVLQAIEATLDNPEGQDWLDRFYLMASGKGGTGKYLPMTPERVKEVVENADWEIETIRDGYRPLFVALTKGVVRQTNFEHSAAQTVRRELGRFLIRVFPGPMADKSSMEVPEKYLGRRITVAEARNLGASFCRVVTTTEATKTLASMC